MGSQISADDLGLTLEYLQFTMDAERQVARLVIDRPGKPNAVTNATREQIATLLALPSAGLWLAFLRALTYLHWARCSRLRAEAGGSPPVSFWGGFRIGP